MSNATQRAIQVCALSDLADVVRDTAASHVLTLLSPGLGVTWTDAVRPRAHQHLTFHDMTRPRDDMPEAILPNRDHVADIIAFAQSWQETGTGPLVVHCYAGISRSTAAAYTIACALEPKRSERDVARALRNASSSALPNALIIAHADMQLDRNGRMIEAIDAMENSAPAKFAPQCRPFRLVLTG
jgi:predicted protein tyrosine phosphatase